MCMRSIELWAVPTSSRFIWALTLLGVTGGLAGCSSIEPVSPHDQPITDPTQLYVRLTLDHPAINLSIATPYNALQLTATPRNALGNPMIGLPTPTFTTSDTNIRVTAEGLVTAVAPVTEAVVVAMLIAGPVTHVDTAKVSVTDLSRTLASLSIHPVLPDSAVWWMPDGEGFLSQILIGSVGFFFPPLPRPILQAADAGDQAIVGLMVEYTSLDPTIATIDRWSGIPTLIRTGHVRIVAQTTAYGAVKADTATFVVRPPVAKFFRYDVAFGVRDFPPPGETRISPYSIVAWINVSQDSLTVMFDDPTKVGMPPAAQCDALPDFFLAPGAYCGAGNVILPPDPDLTFTGIRYRQFVVPGIYPYHVVPGGATGQVAVTSELN